MTRCFELLVAALAVACIVGCSKSPDQLYQDALNGEKQAQEAYSQNDSKSARRAADQASKAASKLKKLSESNQPSEELKVTAAEAAARAARKHAEMATEEQERRELFGSLKVKAYQNGREILFNQLLKQMAAAAEAVGKRSTTEASTVEATLAAQAWKLTSLIGVAEPLADGSPDWSGTSAQLLNWSTNQTIEFRGFFSLALASIGRTDFALVELETIPTNSLEGANALALHHGGRTILYSARGWDHLAAQEAAKFNGLVAKSSSPDDGKVLVAGMHAFLAYQAGKERDFQRLDAEIAQCVRIWPENPMLVYLTGEKLAENGEWEKAAESLEASVAGTKNEWLAKRLAERARELRDGKGNTKAFVMDASFLVPFVVQSLAIQAEDSAMGKKLTQYLEEAKSFGQGLSRQLFGKESDKPEEIQ